MASATLRAASIRRGESETHVITSLSREKSGIPCRGWCSAHSAVNGKLLSVRQRLQPRRGVLALEIPRDVKQSSLIASTRRGGLRAPK